MPLPTITKTWQHNVNQALATTSNVVNDAKAALYAIKNSLVSFGSAPWTVVRSSNSTSAGASDYWSSASSVVFATAGNAHSWIILQQTGITGGGPTQLLLDCGYTGPGLRLAVSPSGVYAGGTTTASPTATDNMDLITAGVTYWCPASAVNMVLNVSMTSTGSSTRFWLLSSGSRWLWTTIDTLDECSLNCRMSAFGKGNTLIYADMFSNAWWGCVNNSGTPIWNYTATQVYNNVMVVGANSGAASNITSAYPMTPLSLYSETANYRGRFGRIPDMWFGSTALANGSAFPASASRTHAQFGPLVVPWNGTVPVIA